jgi:hypothetical protein
MADQFKYQQYLSGYTLDTEPNVMIYNGSGSLGAMSSKEALARVMSSPLFLMWEYELKHGKETGK